MTTRSRLTPDPPHDGSRDRERDQPGRVDQRSRRVTKKSSSRYSLEKKKSEQLPARDPVEANSRMVVLPLGTGHRPELIVSAGGANWLPVRPERTTFRWSVGQSDAAATGNALDAYRPYYSNDADPKEGRGRQYRDGSAERHAAAWCSSR